MSTVTASADHARRYLEPHLGRVLLAELSVGQVEEMFTAIPCEHKSCRAAAHGGDGAADPATFADRVERRSA
jgi:hypothetical protein